MHDPHDPSSLGSPPPGDSISGQELPPPLPPAPSLLQTIFFGPYGLRAGWRLLIYFALAATCYFLLALLARALLHPGRGFQPGVVFAGESLLFLSAFIPAVIMGAIEKRSLAAYGLPARGAFGKSFWVGNLWGLVAISALIFALHGTHAFDYGHLVLHGARIIKWAFYWGVFFLLVGLFEEFSFRGYTLFTLYTGIDFWPAAVLLSAAFGGVHLGNPGEEWVGGLSAGLIGLFFCLTLRRTGSLWWAIGFHLSFDWGETFLYSVPNSGFVTPGHLLSSTFHGPRWLTGGSVGPEGSVLVFVLIALLFILFNALYREVKYPVDAVRAAAISPPEIA